MQQKPSTIAEDGTLGSKTSCFTVSDSSDKCATPITPDNKLIINGLERKVIDNQMTLTLFDGRVARQRWVKRGSCFGKRQGRVRFRDLTLAPIRIKLPFPFVL